MPILRQFRAAPNLLTLLRLFIIPFLVIAILDGRFKTAIVLFLLAGVSDGLDGLLARWLKQQTALGLYLDPIADKLLLSTLFVVFTHVGLVPRYVTVLVFSRDLGLVLIGTVLFATHTLREFRPSLFGKLNTCIQIFTLAMVMVDPIRDVSSIHSLRSWMLRITAYSAIASAAEYAWIVLKRINSSPAAAVPTTR
ncbi:MAG: CDP-alcohol phosphatidyltransferase family protein [Acidobacteriaceae bacterium]|jgi:cardiolipin synthase|nr:CDP-alcohol phosphatidyltransferase family protein [Acidobacteriaceae bacterium]